MKNLYRIRKKNTAAIQVSKSTSRSGKMKRKLFCSSFKHVEEYCDNSSVHGFRYFSDKNIHGFERLWWILSFVLSMVGCIMLIRDSYQKWDESPVIVTFSEKMTSIKSIPFPAVTVCPETKSVREVFNYQDVFNKINRKDPPYFGLSQDEFILLSTHLQICDLDNSIRWVRSFEEKIANDTIFDLLRTTAPNITYSLMLCKFRTVDFDCDDIFQEIVTTEGLCFTLNSLSNEEMFHNGSNSEIIGNADMRGVTGHWTMEDGYDFNETAEASPYPYRVFTSGSNVGLVLTLSVNEVDMDYACKGPQQGFKVILHSPNELPDVNGQYFRIPVMEDIRMSIKPNMMITSKSLQDYSPDRRQCYFNAERKLRYMKSYTQQNCQLECISNFTLKKCGCVKFSMPRDNETPICGVANLECSLNSVDEFWKYADLDDTKNCNCLPACTSISYDAEISQAKYEFDKYLDAISEVYPAGLKLSHLSIFFKGNQFVSSKRSELIGMTDFVAACGGLLGLFMGISLLSIVEFVYYFSLRLWCSSRLKNSTKHQEAVSHSKKNRLGDSSKNFIPPKN